MNERPERQRLLIFVIAYYAESTLRRVLERIPSAIFQEFDCEILVVDDASLDRTFAIGREYKENHPDIPMTVLRNEGRWDRSNVLYEDNQIALYHKDGRPGMKHIDYGLSAFRRELFDKIDAQVFDLADLFHELSLRRQLAGFEVQERFYEIGSPAGLRDLEQYFEAREEASCPRI